MKERVVVTGLGAVSPIGQTIDELWQAIETNVCGISQIQSFDTGEYKVKLAAEVQNFEPENWFDKRDLKFNDRFTRFARVAARQAWMDSGLNIEQEEAERIGVLFSSGIGGIASIEKSVSTLADRGPAKVSPYFIPMALSNLAAGQIAIDVGAKGCASCMVSACAAGSNAIGDAMLRIQNGLEDIIVAGGAEASITPVSIAGFQSMRALYTGDNPDRASIPFDADRSGFVMGEGAGALILESLSHAQARGAKIYGEIVGYGASCDAHHITAPDPEGKGAALAMKKALQMAQMKPEEIDYINAHGTSTSLNDKAETLAVKRAFEQAAGRLLITSTKSRTGHLLGASGALEAVISVLSLQHGLIPATIHYQNPDADCDLKIVTENIDQNISSVMSNSFGFGGHNISLIFKSFDSRK